MLAAAALFLVALPGCSKPEGEGVATAGGAQVQNSADPDKPSDSPEERVRQFVNCMRAEGIDVADPEPGDATGKSALRFAVENTDKAKLGAAMEKCSRYMPAGGENVRLTPEEIEQVRQFARCMRENGAPDWPDPDADGNFKPGASATINKDDPAVRAALEKCRAAR